MELDKNRAFAKNSYLFNIRNYYFSILERMSFVLLIKKKNQSIYERNGKLPSSQIGDHNLGTASEKAKNCCGH